jgi:hypothetical protein
MDFADATAPGRQSPYLDGIPWSETRPLIPGGAETPTKPPPPDLPVWSVRLP